jgi:hypothetical protein
MIVVDEMAKFMDNDIVHDPVALVVGDATENISQPSLGIDAIELGCLNQRIDDCRDSANRPG